MTRFHRRFTEEGFQNYHHLWDYKSTPGFPGIFRVVPVGDFGAEALEVPRGRLPVPPDKTGKLTGDSSGFTAHERFGRGIAESLVSRNLSQWSPS